MSAQSRFNSHLNTAQTANEVQLQPKRTNAAPIYLLPAKIQDIVADWVACFQLPEDFYLAGVLAAASAAIGNSYRIRIKEGHSEPAILWPVLVGPSSAGKTPAINTCLAPLKEIEIAYWREYVLKQAENAASEDKGEKVIRRKIIVNNSTMEALATVLAGNDKGLLLYMDEILGWVESMNQYRGGGDEQAWLSFFSGELLNHVRLSRDEVFVERPFVSVIGGIQPGVLQSLAAGSRKKNGFLFRLLFAWPENFSRPYPNDRELNPQTTTDYAEIIRELHAQTVGNMDSDGAMIPEELEMADDAKDVFSAWQKVLIDRQNDSDEDEVSMLGKIETYAKRLALVIELLNRVCDGFDVWASIQITKRSMIAAVRLADYFTRNAEKVLDFMQAEPDPEDMLPQKQLDLFKKIPIGEFTTADAVKMGKDLAIPERNVKRMLTNKGLFTRLERGKYCKVVARTARTARTNTND